MTVQTPQSQGLLATLAQSLSGQQQQAADPTLAMLSGTPAAPAPTQQAADPADTQGEITVTAPRRPPVTPVAPAAPFNPSVMSNAGELQGLQQLQSQQSPSPRSQHGVLGQILGHLGDAFLVGSNRAPQYQPRMDQQAISQAMVGAETDPMAAAARVAATGVPGAAEASRQVLQQANEMKLRQQIQEQNNQYKQSMVQSRADQATQRMLPYVGNMVGGAKTIDDYTQAYSRADAIAKRLDPNSDAGSAFGLVPPEQWQPGMMSGAGVTAGQQLRADTTKRGQDMTQQNTETAAGSRITAAQIYAHAHPTQPNMPTELNEIGAKIDNGTATPSEKAIFSHFASPPRSAGIHLGSQPTGSSSGGQQSSVPITMAGPNNPVANGGKPVTPDQARNLPSGTHFLTSDGRWLVR